MRIGAIVLRARPRDVALERHTLEWSVTAGLDRADLVFESAFGGRLQGDVERCVDLQTFAVQLGAKALIELLSHPLDEIRCDLAGVRLRGELQRVRLCEARIGVA